MSALAARTRIDASTLALVAFALVAELVLAVIVAEARFDRYVALIIAAALGAVALRLPLAAILGILALAASIFHRNYFPTIGYGPVAFHFYEAALIALFLLATARPKRRTWGAAVGGALAAFLGSVLLAIAFGVSADRVALHDAFDWSRPFIMLLLFYVVVRLFPDRQSALRLLTGAAAVAVLIGAVALITALGSALDSTLQDPANTQIRPDLGAGALDRIRMPGIALTYTLFWFALVQLLTRDRNRAGWFIVFLACVATEALTFNRNMWIGLGVTFVLLVVLLAPRVRHRVLAVLVVILASIAVLALAGQSVSPDSRLYPLVERGSTLFSPDNLSEEGSVTSREHETKRAWATAQQHLATGASPGAAFGVFHREDPGFTGGQLLRAPQLFLHNQYLYLLVAGGIPMLGSFLLFIGLALRRAWRRAPRDPTLVALGCGLVAIMISATVEIYFTTDNWTATIGLVTGAIVAMTSQYERPRRRLGSPPPPRVREPAEAPAPVA